MKKLYPTFPLIQAFSLILLFDSDFSSPVYFFIFLFCFFILSIFFILLSFLSLFSYLLSFLGCYLHCFPFAPYASSLRHRAPRKPRNCKEKNEREKEGSPREEENESWGEKNQKEGSGQKDFHLLFDPAFSSRFSTSPFYFLLSLYYFFASDSLLSSLDCVLVRYICILPFSSANILFYFFSYFLLSSTIPSNSFLFSSLYLYLSSFKLSQIFPSTFLKNSFLLLFRPLILSFDARYIYIYISQMKILLSLLFSSFHL